MLCFRQLGVFLSCVVFLVIRPSRGAHIIDGREVVPHSRPFMALLQGKDSLCGGTLIAPKWVLTAAHCTSMKKVMLGVHDRRGEKKEAWKVMSVKKSIPHPCYNSEEDINDLMLIKLSKAAKMTETVRELRLPKDLQDPKDGTQCEVAGWGDTDAAGKRTSNVLMAANVTVVGRAKCNDPQHYNSDPVITKRMVCAGSDGKNHADTCLGDSGGPLICGGMLTGVTSFGRRCGEIRYPGVYSLLTKTQIDWIITTMKNN